MQGSFNIHISVFSAGLYWSRYREGVFSSKSLGSFFCYVNPNIALFESPAFVQFNSIYMYIYGCMCHNNNMYPTLIALALTCENLSIVKMLVHQTNLLSHFIIWFIRIQLLFECAHLAWVLVHVEKPKSVEMAYRDNNNSRWASTRVESMHIHISCITFSFSLASPAAYACACVHFNFIFPLCTSSGD